MRLYYWHLSILGEITEHLSQVTLVLHNSAEGSDVISGGIHSGVDAVQKRYVTDAVLREVPLHVVASQDIIAAQATQIFSNDHVDLPGLDVGNHALEIWAIES